MNLRFSLALIATLAPLAARADDTLALDEQVNACAEGLVVQRECKADYCAAMGDMQASAMATAAQVKETCLKQIEADGSRDLAGRKQLCSTVLAATGKIPFKQSDHAAMQACWKLPTCPDRVACWRPHFEKVMKLMMSAALQKAPPPAKK